MKKTLIFIAFAMLFCTVTKAQDYAFNSDNSFQTSLLEQPQTSLNSIYSLPMPTTDFATGNQFNTQQFASQKGWGIACIISGGVIMMSGAVLWLWGGVFTNVTNQAATMDANMAANMAANMDPSTAADMAASMENTSQDPTLKKANNVGKGVKTAGIIGTAAGAVLVGTGIVLLTSNSGSGGGGYSRSKSNKPHRTKKRKGHARSNPRHAELMPDYSDMQPDWSLCLNVGPASAGLTLAF